MSGAKPKIKKLAEALLDWFAREARDLPWRRTRDPYAIWVSEIMLQQTQVKTVIPYWERWMRALPDLQALARARPERLHKLWEGLGYYSRVRNLQLAARQIQERHGGKFPEDFEQVLNLSGIGRYTAGAICSIVFQQARPILDGNVIRVLTRVHGLAGDPKERSLNQRLWRLAEDWVRAVVGRHGCLNESLMELGALVCLPRDPRCGDCPLHRSCVARREGRTAELPGNPKRAPATSRRFAAFVVKRNGRFLVVQRPRHVVNGSLWEFPNVELGCPDAVATKTIRARSSRRQDVLTAAPDDKPLCTIKHSITRYRITLQAFEVDSTDWLPERAGQGRWLTLAEMQKLAFTSAHRKIIGFLRSRQASRS